MEGLQRGRAEGSGGKRWGQKGYGGGAIFRAAASSLAPSPLVVSYLPSLLALPLPTSILKKNERAPTHTLTHTHSTIYTRTIHPLLHMPDLL